MPNAIEIKNLRKTYASGTKALKGITFNVEEGDFFALLGPNGSGKTTLIGSMGGPIKKTSGTIKVFGQDIDTNRVETQKVMGIVPQEIHFDSFFTVNETLQFQSGYYGIRNNQEWIDEVLHNIELYDKKHTITRALSGGMKRRLLIAQALVHQPKLIVLDEPTAGVDVDLRHNLWEYMKRLNREGHTILLTTHYIEEAESLCKKTAIIDKGKLVALDDTKKLIRTLGDKKVLTISSKTNIKEAPKDLKKYNPEILSENELSLTFCGDQINQVLTAIQKSEIQIADLDLTSTNLEDVFMELTHKKNG